MIAIPWFLLALGIFLLIVGSLLVALRAANPPRRKKLDDRMRDDEIVRHLQEEQRITLPQVIIFVGMMCILISFAARMGIRFTQ